jgi:hypothetical protein
MARWCAGLSDWPVDRRLIKTPARIRVLTRLLRVKVRLTPPTSLATKDRCNQRPSLLLYHDLQEPKVLLSSCSCAPVLLLPPMRWSAIERYSLVGAERAEC